MIFVAPLGVLTSPIVPSIHALGSFSQLGTRRSLKSPEYIIQAVVSCLRLLTQLILWAFNLAVDNAGRIIDAKMAMIAITTSSSINVKAKKRRPRMVMCFIAVVFLSFTVASGLQ